MRTMQLVLVSMADVKLPLEILSININRYYHYYYFLHESLVYPRSALAF